jgi:hypothetical protein
MKAEIIFERRCDVIQHLYVGASAKELVAMSGYNDYLHSIIHASLENCLVKLSHHLVAIGICRRIAKRQDSCTSINFVLDQDFSKCFGFHFNNSIVLLDGYEDSTCVILQLGKSGLSTTLNTAAS